MTFGRAIAVLLLIAAACGGTDAATTQATPAPSSTAAPTTATAAPSSTTSSTPDTTRPPLGFEFRQVGEDTAEYSYSIAYPVLVGGDGQPLPVGNSAVESFVAATIAEVAAAAETLDAKATITVQLAPELLNESVFSLSGVSTRFFDAGAGTVSLRHGWIIDLSDGSAVPAADLFLGGNLEALAAAAADHLISDVLGSEDDLAGPDGLLPVPANFDAVWITTTGVGVGFDEGQVAAPAVGSPAVFIPFAEIDAVLDKSGVLAPLESAPELPEL